jgi:hypothetical protein
MENKHLTTIIGITDYKQEAKITKQNLIADLKLNFPGTKFSVTKSNYSTYNVNLTDGPTSAEVEKVTDKYEEYESSPCGDFHDRKQSDFNKQFGGFKYIFTRREFSEPVKALLQKCEEIVSGIESHKYNEGQELFYRIMQKTNLPKGFDALEIERTEQSSGLLVDLYQVKVK